MELRFRPKQVSRVWRGGFSPVTNSDMDYFCTNVIRPESAPTTGRNVHFWSKPAPVASCAVHYGLKTTLSTSSSLLWHRHEWRVDLQRRRNTLPSLFLGRQAYSPTAGKTHKNHEALQMFVNSWRRGDLTNQWFRLDTLLSLYTVQRDIVGGKPEMSS